MQKSKSALIILVSLFVFLFAFGSFYLGYASFVSEQKDDVASASSESVPAANALVQSSDQAANSTVTQESSQSNSSSEKTFEIKDIVSAEQGQELVEGLTEVKEPVAAAAQPDSDTQDEVASRQAALKKEKVVKEIKVSASASEFYVSSPLAPEQAEPVSVAVEPSQAKETTQKAKAEPETQARAVLAKKSQVSKDIDVNASVQEAFLEGPAEEEPLLLAQLLKEGPAKQEGKGAGEEPIVVNGDKIEYSTTSKDVTVSGKALVIYKGSKLTCDKITMDTQAKEGVAEGHVRLEDKQGIIEGEKITYNFNTNSGVIIGAGFRSNPYFGKARDMERVSEKEFAAKRAFITTCSLDNPHYRFGVGKMNFFPHDKVQAKEATFYVGGIPLLYIPKYEHSFQDPLMHVQISPGHSKDWGYSLLSAWRYRLTDNVTARLYLDYRSKLGIAEGFGTNYTTPNLGKGDFKFYYTHEVDTKIPEGQPNEFQRYLIRWRHKWDVDEQTNVIAEYYKIVDSKMAVHDPEDNFLKDYFYREYELDEQPPSYFYAHRAFTYSSLDFLMRQRTNRWYDAGYLEALPEIKYNLPTIQIGNTPLYFDHYSSVGNYNLKNTSTMTPTTNALTPDTHVNRSDMFNKFLLPMKLAFLQFTPYVANEETIYSRDALGNSFRPRTIFYAGADMSTKLYRLYDINSRMLGMEINGLRHIFTPSIRYEYNHEPTISATNLRQIDSTDAITSNNGAILELSNKLQTKRDGKRVDLLDFRVDTAYEFKSKYEVVEGGHFSDVIFNIDFLPYSWLRFKADATLNRSVDRTDTNFNRFTEVNYDLNFNLGEERSLGIGQRYARKESNQLTSSFDWRLNPKWKFSIYNRYEMGDPPDSDRGMLEQEYTITRDLHCWEMDFTYNIRKESGHTVWLIFRLKAFPELEFNFSQSYHEPRSGSQSGD